MIYGREYDRGGPCAACGSRKWSSAGCCAICKRDCCDQCAAVVLTDANYSTQLVCGAHGIEALAWLEQRTGDDNEHKAVKR